jgi:hypothetical protein
MMTQSPSPRPSPLPSPTPAAAKGALDGLFSPWRRPWANFLGAQAPGHQPALGTIDELLIATVAGSAGEASSAYLTAAVQGRTLLAMRYGGTLTRAETSAPAQHINSVATVETFIVKTGAALAEQGLEPTTLRRARDRILTRGANSAAGALTPLETAIAADVSLSNAAHTDPAKRETTDFTPIVVSASGAMGPSTVAFLKDVYARANAAGKFQMTQNRI